MEKSLGPKVGVLPWESKVRAILLWEALSSLDKDAKEK